MTDCQITPLDVPNFANVTEIMDTIYFQAFYILGQQKTNKK